MRLHADTVSYSNTGMFTYEVYARNILVPYIQSFTLRIKATQFLWDARDCG